MYVTFVEVVFFANQIYLFKDSYWQIADFYQSQEKLGNKVLTYFNWNGYCMENIFNVFG